MKHYLRSFIGYCCCALTLLPMGVAQTSMALSQRDSMRIRSLSQAQLDEFITLLNNVSDRNTYAEDFEDFVLFAVEGGRKIFYNSRTTVQPDLDPELPPGQEYNFRDVQEIQDYLTDFRTFYPRTTRRTVSIKDPLVSEIRFSEALGYFYMKIKYTSIFAGKHTTKQIAFPRRTRVAQFRIEKIQGDWKSYITSLRFFNPSDADRYREADAFEKAFNSLKEEGDKMLMLHEYQEAMKQYSEAQIQVPNDFYINNQIAKLEVTLSEMESRKFYSLDSYNSRIRSAESNRANESDLPDLYYERGSMHERDKKYTEALEDYRKVVSIAPKFRKAYIKIAAIERRQNHVPEAIIGYSKAVDLHLFPNDIGLLEILAQLELEVDMTEEARNHLMKALEFQERPDLYLKLGDILFLGEINTAIFNYQQAVRINPNYVDARWRLGRAYLRIQNFEKAGNEFREAITQRPRLRRDLNEMIDQQFIKPALAEKSRKRLEAAEILATNALQVEPSDQSAKKILREINEIRAEQEAKLSRAARAAVEAQREEERRNEPPKSLQFYQNAVIAYNTQRYHDAAELAENAIIMDKNYAEANLLRARALMKLAKEPCDNEEIDILVSDAVKQAPENALANYYLGQLWTNCYGKPKKGQKYFKKAFQLDPNLQNNPPE